MKCYVNGKEQCPNEQLKIENAISNAWKMLAALVLFGFVIIFLFQYAKAHVGIEHRPFFLYDESQSSDLEFGATIAEAWASFQLPNPEPEITVPNTPYIDGGGYKNERIAYAWNVSGGDRDFVLTLNAENGAWAEDVVSTIKYERNGQLWSDEGMCQISRYYYTEIVTDPRFSDWKWQVEKCWELYSGGTRFYGYDVRHKKNNIIFP